MMVTRTKYLYLALVTLLVCGCTKPIDFDQANDLVLQPVIESSLIFYSASASDFFVGGSEQSTAEDFVEIDLFGGSFIQDNLVRVEFVFEIENSINRAYQLRLNFLDENNQLLESFNVNTDASPNNEVIASTHMEVFEGDALERLKQSRIIAFTLVMQPGEAINQDTPGEISVKSKGVFSLNID
ncbi:hypothetical protein EYD45_13200 [Hyunsoonleella flava]|uniref:Uncharacterized protein n=2 Tax=Pseudomonadati TaxID=3379134 RepID=A0A4Q9FBF2_9FLAO|nr:hypothetical protein [Hyunsoonleella flava]TBN01357.1 hypothetical protein EYD45_13200 [Hyunsoonleella flava]